jgi:S1-C subfamily serine protease
MSRGLIPTLLFAFSAIVFFGLGNLLAARQAVTSDNEQIAALRAEVGALKRQRTGVSGTSGRTAETGAVGLMDDRSRAALVADIKQQLKKEMGLLPVRLLRERRQSFVELYSYDATGASNYGTAGYLGEGYFITVKHGVIALGDAPDSRRITSVKIMYKGRAVAARVVDAGDAQVEVDPGDWAILKVNEPIDLPALDVNVAYGFDFADPIFRLGNDYSKGIILSTGNVGQRTPNNLVTCLTDGHPGVSGGGVLNGDGQLVGIPIGRMQGDYRFSFILPLRGEMFRKISFLN